MDKRTHILIIIIFLFLIIPLSSSSALSLHELEWKVKIGDSKTYTVDKYFDDTDFDGDGDKYKQTVEVTDEDGERVDVVLEKGTTLKVTITDLNDIATVKFTCDSNVTTGETSILLPSLFALPAQSMVAKTVDNKKYWENLAENKHGMSVEGDFVVIEDILTDLTLDPETEITVKRRNWKTGWVTYVHRKITNWTDTIAEIEFSTEAAGLPGFKITPIVLGIVVITLLAFSLYLNRRVREGRNEKK
ncbi:MAG: hypothetical protein ACFFAJ_16960 [Candidatus Hodarchaeota archaeon]